MLQKEPLPEFLNSGPGPPLTTCRAWPPRYDVAPARATRRASDGMSNGVYVRRGIHVGHTSARPDEDNVRARMRAQSRVRWFERKAITRSGARERRPHFATALAERAHERAKPRRRRAVDLSGACTRFTSDISKALKRFSAPVPHKHATTRGSTSHVRAHEREKSRRRRAVDLSGACTNARSSVSEIWILFKLNFSIHQ